MITITIEIDFPPPETHNQARIEYLVHQQGQEKGAEVAVREMFVGAIDEIMLHIQSALPKSISIERDWKDGHPPKDWQIGKKKI